MLRKMACESSYRATAPEKAVTNTKFSYPKRLRKLHTHLATSNSPSQMRSSVHGASGVGSVIKGMAGLGGLSLGAHIAYEVRKHGLVESWHKSLKRKGTAFRLTEAGRWAGVRSGLLHFMYVWRQRRLRADPKVDAMAEAMAVGDMHASFYEHTGELNDPAQKEQKTASAYAEMMLATRNRKGAVLDIDSATDGLPRYTKQEVATHRSKSDCWLIIRNRVYDVTSWLPSHPGGPRVLLQYAGTDATSVFRKIEHSPSAHRWLREFLVGILDTEDTDIQQQNQHRDTQL